MCVIISWAKEKMLLIRTIQSPESFPPYPPPPLSKRPIIPVQQVTQMIGEVQVIKGKKAANSPFPLERVRGDQTVHMGGKKDKKKRSG